MRKEARKLVDVTQWVRDEEPKSHRIKA